MLLGSQGRKQLAALGSVGLVGIEMGVSILVGHFGGSWLDGKFGTAPWLATIGFVFGVFAGFRNLVRIARKEWQKAESLDAESTPPHPDESDS